MFGRALQVAGLTAVHWAVHLEAPQVLELLLERGANLEIRTEKDKDKEKP